MHYSVTSKRGAFATPARCVGTPAHWSCLAREGCLLAGPRDPPAAHRSCVNQRCYCCSVGDKKHSMGSGGNGRQILQIRRVACRGFSAGLSPAKHIRHSYMNHVLAPAHADECRYTNASGQRSHTLVVVALLVGPQDACQPQIMLLKALCRGQDKLGWRPAGREAAQSRRLTIRRRNKSCISWCIPAFSCSV